MTLEQMQNNVRQDIINELPIEAEGYLSKEFTDSVVAATWKAAQESAYNEIEAVFIKHVPPHAFDLEDGVWIKRLLNKAFKNNKHE